MDGMKFPKHPQPEMTAQENAAIAAKKKTTFPHVGESKPYQPFIPGGKPYVPTEKVTNNKAYNPKVSGLSKFVRAIFSKGKPVLILGVLLGFAKSAQAVAIFQVNGQVALSTFTPTLMCSTDTDHQTATTVIINNSGFGIVIGTSPISGSYSTSVTTGNAQIPAGSSLTLGSLNNGWWGPLYGLSLGASAANIGIIKY